MMRTNTWRFTVLFAVSLHVTIAIAQSSEADIDAAIKAGLAKKNLAVAVDAFDFTVVVEGPLARVAAAAREAASEYKPFIRADVSPTLLEPTLTISAFPDGPTVTAYRGLSSTNPATHLVVIAKGGKGTPIQPLSKETFAQSWGNALGAKVEGQGIRAIFALSDLPPGEFDVMVVCQGCPTDRKGQIKKKDRVKIR